MKRVLQAALAVALLLELAQAQPLQPGENIYIYKGVAPASNCGTVSNTRIVGGTPVERAGKWPWLAVLSAGPGENFEPSCGGTLISTRHVLTAAHCYVGKDDPKYVRLGENNYTSHTDGNYPKDYLIISHVNADYNTNTRLNDLELLTLSETVVFTDLVRPACLPTPAFSNINFGNTIFSAVGWGDTVDGAKNGSQVARFVELSNVDINKCVQIYADNSGIIDPKLQICAGDNKVDTCQGDSGGPLQYLNKEDNRYYVVGVVSYGIKCADPVFPGVYGRVDAYLTWINKIIGSA